MAASLNTHLTFHNVHSETVRLSKNNSVARRIDTKKSYVFSNRPISLEEEIRVRITTLGTVQRGPFRVGVTSFDPQSFQMDFVIYPNLSNDIRLKYLNFIVEKHCRPGNFFNFGFNEIGELHFNINSASDQGTFVNVPDFISYPHWWFVVELSGMVMSVELVHEDLLNQPIQESIEQAAEKTRIEKSLTLDDAVVFDLLNVSIDVETVQTKKVESNSRNLPEARRRFDLLSAPERVSKRRCAPNILAASSPPVNAVELEFGGLCLEPTPLSVAFQPCFVSTPVVRTTSVSTQSSRPVGVEPAPSICLDSPAHEACSSSLCGACSSGLREAPSSERR